MRYSTHANIAVDTPSRKKDILKRQAIVLCDCMMTITEEPEDKMPATTHRRKRSEDKGTCRGDSL